MNANIPDGGESPRMSTCCGVTADRITLGLYICQCCRRETIGRLETKRERDQRITDALLRISMPQPVWQMVSKAMNQP